jgi:hypothetical protein
MAGLSNLDGLAAGLAKAKSNPGYVQNQMAQDTAKKTAAQTSQDTYSSNPNPGVMRDPKTGKIANLEELAFARAKWAQNDRASKGDFEFSFQSLLDSSRDYLNRTLNDETAINAFLQTSREETFKKDYENSLKSYDQYSQQKAEEAKIYEDQARQLTDPSTTQLMSDTLISEGKKRISNAYNSLGLTGASLSAAALGNALNSVMSAKQQLLESRQAQAAKLLEAATIARGDTATYGEQLRATNIQNAAQLSEMSTKMGQLDASIAQKRDQASKINSLGWENFNTQQSNAMFGAIGQGVGFASGLLASKYYKQQPVTAQSPMGGGFNLGYYDQNKMTSAFGGNK